MKDGDGDEDGDEDEAEDEKKANFTREVQKLALELLFYLTIGMLVIWYALAH